MVSKSQLYAEINKVIVESNEITPETTDEEIRGMAEILTAQLFAAREEQRRQLKSVKARQKKWNG